MNKKVVIGMSGGVDSSVSAYLLKEMGYEVIGVTMKMWHEACSEKSVDDARSVAKTIGIPFYEVDFSVPFKSKVVDYFLEEYLQGRTPNPCIACNRYVKWEALLEFAKEMGADYIATGHYARKVELPNGRYSVSKAKADKKDQTYVLYNLTQEQLKATLMPAGEYTKEEIRDMAKKLGLDVADKPDSQDICFVPDGDYATFINTHSDTRVKEGNFVDVQGNVLGTHKGIIHYTVGQRKGLNLALGHPVFVLQIRPETNEVVIGESEETFTKEIYCNKINLLAVEKLPEGERVIAKIRYSHKGSECVLSMVGEDRIKCTFDEPVRAATPGQAVVFYKEDYVYGGGIIE